MNKTKQYLSSATFLNLKEYGHDCTSSNGTYLLLLQRTRQPRHRAMTECFYVKVAAVNFSPMLPKLFRTYLHREEDRGIAMASLFL